MAKRYMFDAIALGIVASLMLGALCAGAPNEETTILSDSGITLDNLVVSDTVMLQDGVKLYLDTAKTTGFQYRSAIDSLEILSSNPYIVCPIGLDIAANVGEDGLGAWYPEINFSADGNLYFITEADKFIRFQGGNVTLDTDKTVDGVDVGSHDHSGGDMGIPIAGIASGLQADKPAGTFAGQVYFAADTDNLWIYNGTVWMYTQMLS